MQAIISVILPSLLKVVGYFIEKGIKNAENKRKARNAYYGFIKEIEGSFTDSARLRKSAQLQRKWLQEKAREDFANDS